MLTVLMRKVLPLRPCQSGTPVFTFKLIQDIKSIRSQYTYLYDEKTCAQCVIKAKGKT